MGRPSSYVGSQDLAESIIRFLPQFVGPFTDFFWDPCSGKHTFTFS